MSTFRTALRVAAGHPLYLGIYVVMLSLLGALVVGTSGLAAVDGGAYERYDACVAVVDRDGSALSRALAAWLGEKYELADVADEPRALQDALATSAADCVLVLPDGFGEGLLDAARAGEDPAALEVAYGTDAQAGALAAQAASQWVSLAAAAAALEPGAAADEVAARTGEAAAAEVDVAVLASEDALGGADALVTYLNFSTYSLTSSIVVVAGVTLAALGRTELRRRALASPVSPTRRSLGALGACLLLVAVVWAWTCLVALASCAPALEGTDPALVALALAVLLVFALVPLSMAFLLAQLGLGEEAVNAVGNIGGMIFSFLGGAWMPLALLPESVQQAGRLSPTYWASTAITSALHAERLTTELLAEVGLCAGIVALFAVALVAVGLALGRSRRVAAPGA